MTTMQFILLIVVAGVAGMGSVLDECQFHRPLIACTLVGLVLGDVGVPAKFPGNLDSDHYCARGIAWYFCGIGSGWLFH